MIIFLTGSLAGVLGAIIIGPRYGLFMNPKDEKKVPGTNEVERKTLGALLEEALEDTADVDDLFLSKIRRMIKRDGEDIDFYYCIHFPRMILGTLLVTLGFSFLNTCGAG